MAANRNSKKSPDGTPKTPRPKTGGRKAGTPNKVTKELREMLSDISKLYFSDGIPCQVKDPDNPKKMATVMLRFSEDLLLMKASERSDRMIKLLAYQLPKYQSISISADSGRSQTSEEYIKTISDQYQKKAVEIDMRSLKIYDFQ